MFPTGGKYVEALQNPGRCLTDTELKAATIHKSRLGLPQPISGNFSCVFHATSPGGRQYAIKCFTREVPHQMERYAVIHDQLAMSKFRWATDFIFTRNGIKVDGTAYPILRMDWVDALPLNDWLTRNIGNPRSVAMLADQFDQIVADMSSAGIAHGDLQHGNLLVQGDGTLRLVDYDGMYFPQLGRLPPNEYGHPNYQSPRRSERDYGPAIDHFSAWLISLSLRAIAADRSLWDLLNPRNDEYLLLDHSDLARSDTSARFARLLTHRDPQARELAIRIREFLTMPVSVIPKPELLTVAPLGTQHPVASNADGPQSSAPLPSWMNSRIRTSERAAESAAPDRRAAGGRVRISAGRHTIWYSRIALAAGLAAAGAAVITTWLLIGTAVIYAAWLAWALADYRRNPQARTYAELRSRRGKAKAASAAARKRVARTEKKEESLEKRLAAMTKQIDKRRSICQADYDRKIKNLEHRYIPVDRELAKLQTNKQQEINRRLASARAAFVSRQLATARITSRQIPGIGPKNVMSLNAAGIYSAADFSGIVVQPGMGYSSALLFRLSNGRQIRVPGIGVGKGRAIDTWRQQQVARANAQAPKTLPSSDLQTINSAFAALEYDLRRQRKRIEDELSKDRAVLNNELYAGIAAIEADRRQAESSVADERRNIDAERADRQAQARGSARAAEDLEEQIRALGKPTFARFLWSALLGRSS